MESELAALERYAEEKPPDNGKSVTLDISAGLSIIMIDLDGFKQINDEYGHHAGDLALLQVRDILQKCCRKSDTIIRWGGDEFLIVGRHSSRRGAEKYAERMRVELAQHQYQIGGGDVARLSGSIGVTMFPFVPNNTHMLTWNLIPSVDAIFVKIAKDSDSDRRFTDKDKTSFLKVDLKNPGIGQEIISHELEKEIKSHITE